MENGARRMIRRNGYTLIEMLITLSIVIAMLGGTLGLVRLVRTSSKHASDAAIHRQEIRRLANDLRRDVASAGTIEVIESSLILKSADDSQITYELAPSAWISRDAESADAQPIASDRYLIDERSQVNFRLQPISDEDPETEPSLVELTITLPDRPDQPIQILAAPRMLN
ncbi:MAG TPA: prepilin-type cleavage/methylation domain-containing protein [Rhodopirellula baltica]|uniref:Type II secretion system protein n=1 Tax=Rhodopirellula baltica (strain DSM 10527 / NCIMB 13988 / SH1) TaxID=243090 RepID=Q7UZ88_RHOBA|nr:hypothetical protein-transmembrane prediction [Rhodopirellula baltica SH 1]HBE65559.1 prepilin-type cleavage/methylation domain-containing protein [Rhodopirellula baltica]